eukprot:4759555-Amphidinium_carterae.1
MTRSSRRTQIQSRLWRKNEGDTQSWLRQHGQDKALRYEGAQRIFAPTLGVQKLALALEDAKSLGLEEEDMQKLRESLRKHDGLEVSQTLQYCVLLLSSQWGFSRVTKS